MRAALVVAGVLCAGAVARAEPDAEPDAAPDAEAARLFEAGRQLAAQGKSAAACERFAESYELERAPGTMLNLAECAERAGELGHAWELLDAAAREYDRSNRPSSARFARARADALAPQLAVVVVRIADPGVPGLSVRIAGRKVAPAAKLRVRRDPGPVKVAASAPGREPFSTTVTGVSGETVSVAVPALRRARAGDDDGGGGGPPPSRRGWRIAFAGSLVMSLAGGLAMLYGSSEIQAAEQTLCTAPGSVCDPAAVPFDLVVSANERGERGQRFALLGVGVTVAGATLGVISLYKGFFAASGPGPAKGRRARVTPLVAPSGLGLGIAGVF